MQRGGKMTDLGKKIAAMSDEEFDKFLEDMERGYFEYLEKEEKR